MTMMIKILSQEAIDDIKINFKKYAPYIKEKTNDRLIAYLSEKGMITDSKIEDPQLDLSYDDDYNISDRKNIEMLYDALSGLSTAIAADERFWAGYAVTSCWDYIKYRRREELAAGDEFDMQTSFLFMRGVKRSCYINCLSRLWWAGNLLYDPSANDHYHAADLVCESAFASTIMLLSSSNLTANKDIILGIMDTLEARKRNGEDIGRYHYVESLKYLNSIGGTFLLDTLSRQEISALVEKILAKVFKD